MDSSNNTTLITVCEISTLYWIIQTVIYPILFSAYILVLYVIIKFRSEFKNSYFTLVVALGVADIITLLYMLHGFICCLLNSNYLGINFDLALTYVYDSIGWYTAFYLNIFLSLNRLIAIAMYSRYKQIWTNNRTIAVVIFCYILGFITNIPYLVLTRLMFSLEDKRDMPTVEINSEAFEYFDLISGCSEGVFIFIVYLLSMVLSVIRIQKLSGIRKQYMREVKMLIQGMIIAAGLIFLEIMYYFPCLGDMSFVIPAIMATGFNPIIYITLDYKLRAKVFSLLKIKKQTGVVSIINLPTFTKVQN